MIRLERTPKGLDAIVQVYDSPDPDEKGIMDIEFYSEMTMILQLPWPMVAYWGNFPTVRAVRCHKKVAASLRDALKAMAAFKGEAYLHKNKYDRLGGVLEFRTQKSTNGQPGPLSTHAWGIAIDINPHIVPFGEEEAEQPDFIVHIFKVRGWNWGGDFSSPRKDKMHFEACMGY